MFSVMVFIAGVLAVQAGITLKPHTGYGQRFRPASSYPIRSELNKPQIVNPIGLRPALNSYGPFFKPFISPIVVNSAPISYGSFTGYPNRLKLHSEPIGQLALRPPSTIRHISSPVVLSSPSIGPVHNGPVFNPATISQTTFEPDSITNVPKSPPVFSQTTTNYVKIDPSVANTQVALNPINSNNIVHGIQETPEKSVSYSISEKNYAYLSRHKIEGQDSPYNPVPGLDSASPSEKHRNTHGHHDKDHPTQKPSDSDNVLKRNAALNEAYQGYVEPSFVNSLEPQVIKHIYFHVPQPEFEEPPPAPVNIVPPKKTYNILFIKTPAQEQQNHAYIQQLLQSRHPQTEEKTFIYVLSKKQDPVQVVMPPQQTRPSSPEVFFVNYQTKLGDITDTDAKDTLVDDSFIESVSTLERKRSVKDSPLKTESQQKQKTSHKV